VPAARDVVRRAARRIAQTPPPIVVGIAWLIVIVYAFPGQLTQDSFDHLREAREGRYTDLHPPLISALWRIVDRIVHGQFGMLVIQTLPLAAGLYAVLRRTFSARGAAWAAAAVLLFPPVMLPMAVIWKDSLMAGLLMLGFGGLLSPRRAARLWGLVALCAATSVRYNAFAATLPLVVLVFEWRPGLPRLRRYAIAFAAWLAITLAAFGGSAALTDQEMHVWHSSLAVHDICGTLAHLDADLPDAELRELFAGTELLVDRDLHGAIRRVYSPRDYQPILKVSAREHPPLWDLPINFYTPAPEAQRDAISRAWRRVLADHPGAYLEHRLAVFAEALYLGGRRPAPVARREFQFPDYARSLGLPTGWSKGQQRATRWMVALGASTPLFVPWLYLAVALALLPLARRSADLAALVVSGVLMELTLLPLAASPDYRYSHWMIVCTVIAVISLTARRARGRGPA
jgi:hypothetical protein